MKQNPQQKQKKDIYHELRQKVLGQVITSDRDDSDDIAKLIKKDPKKGGPK